MTFELARVLGDAAVMLGLGDPDGAAAAREAREILGRLGASAYIERLDCSCRSRGPAAGTSAPRTAHGEGGPAATSRSLARPAVRRAQPVRSSPSAHAGRRACHHGS